MLQWARLAPRGFLDRKKGRRYRGFREFLNILWPTKSFVSHEKIQGFSIICLGSRSDLSSYFFRNSHSSSEEHSLYTWSHHHNTSSRFSSCCFVFQSEPCLNYKMSSHLFLRFSAVVQRSCLHRYLSSSLAMKPWGKWKDVIAKDSKPNWPRGSVGDTIHINYRS